MAGMPVRRLESGAAVAEVDFPGAAPIHQPLQRAIHRGPADAGVLAPDEVEQIVSAQVPFLLQESAQDLFAFRGALARGPNDQRGNTTQLPIHVPS